MEQSVTWTCTGCALLCEDIQVIINNNKIEKVENACLKGKARLFGCKHPARSTINHADADISEAISQAARILKYSENPLLYGWSNSTSEAQHAGIELAQSLGAVIDSTSSFCQGITINEIFKNNLPACTLEDVREKADVIMYWGADPMSSHPRHLSKYSYFPRGEMRQKGYEEDRTAICIDVRQSRTAKICKDQFYMIPPQGDAEFINSLIVGLSGRVPKLDYDIKRILELAATLKKAEFGVIFVGLGLIYSIKSQMQLLLELINKLNEFSNFYLIPMAGHFNMRGFNHNLFEKTGFVHRVKFADEGIRSGIEYSVIEQLKNGADAAVIIGSDPLTSLPASVSRRLKNIPVILIDPCMNLTSKVADITIPCSVSGIGVGGTAIRLDGQTQEISSLIESSGLSDEVIIRRIMKELD
ncbi:MAG TPA: formylmethanofuran dehydrogenase subunit B [archaeon]|nr:formylmethanofuran dehydrogenase subunit B [archaeon]